MTPTPHIPGAEIADARLRIFADSLSDGEWTSALLKAYNPTGETSVSYEQAKAALVADLRREALAARIVPEGWSGGTHADIVLNALPVIEIFHAADVTVTSLTQKEIYNALGYLCRRGDLTRIGFGKFQRPPDFAAALPARPETTTEHIARDIREGRFPEQSERQSALANVPPQVNEAVLWVSGKQLPDFLAQELVVQGYIPARTERTGNFDTPLYASPSPGTATAGASDGASEGEVTDEMLQAGEDAFVLRFAYVPPNPWNVVGGIYRAMAAVAPSASSDQSRVERLETALLDADECLTGIENYGGEPAVRARRGRAAIEATLGDRP